MLSYRRISAALCGALAVAMGAAGPSHLAAAEGDATTANSPTEKKELRIPRVSKPWKDALRLVGDGKTLCSDFALIQDKVGRWHCIGTFGKDGNGVGNGYAESDGYALFHAVGNSLNAPMMFTSKIPYQIVSPQAVMWAPGVIWNKDRSMAYLYYFHFFGSYSPIIDQSGCRLLTSVSPDLSTWLPYAGNDLPERNLVFRDIVNRDFCVFWDARLGKYLMYYCADALKARTSDDLLHWSDPVTVLRDATGSPHGYAESPQVIYRDGYYYLWTSGIDYSHTHLFISEDPFNFGDAVANSIEETPGHAPEIVSDHGIDYMACSMVSTVPSATPAAHDLDGILIQPLRWDKPDPGMAERIGRSPQGNPVAAATASAPPQSAGAPPAPGGFKYFVGIVGNPSVPDISWSDEQLEQIKDLGVNMVQLSIAWGGKPANEVLNLEDLDKEQRGKFAFRIKQAQKHGLKTIAQFGIPKAFGFSRPACILDPAVRTQCAEMLADFMTSFPEVDDVLVYTFDQGAWLCSEFGPCPRCSGIPLDERVPDFLNLLNETMRKCRPNTRLWWKPWELSRGQVVMILDKVQPENFGLVLNPSTSNEVYPFNDRSFKSDLGVKRFVQLAKERGIPVLGEFDHTFYKPLYLMEDFFPRLIYGELAGWKEMEGVVGVKEYYGFAPSTFSVNAAMLKAWMRSPDAPLDTLLREIAEPYGPNVAALMIQAWEYVAQHVEAYPWDVTYLIGPLGLDRPWDGSHGWQPVDIPNATWDTPIWKANRRGNFMLTQDQQAHPWLFEDTGLRLEDSAALGFKAVGFFDQALAAGGGKSDDIRTQREIVWKTARSLRAKSLHFLETLAAQDARAVQNNEKQFAIVTKRLEALLKKDVENQGGQAAVAQKLAEFQRDPKAWVDANLNPRDYKPTPLGGDYESRATLDWSKWLPAEK